MRIRASLRRVLNARLELILREYEQERVGQEARKWGHGPRREVGHSLTPGKGGLMLRFQALVTGVRAITEDMGGEEASLGATGRGGAMGCSGTQSGEGAEPTHPSNVRCQSFCLKGTGSCGGCVNRRK